MRHDATDYDVRDIPRQSNVLPGQHSSFAFPDDDAAFENNAYRNVFSVSSDIRVGAFSDVNIIAPGKRSFQG